MAFSNFLAAELLDHVIKGATYTPPTDVYIALFVTAPNEAGTGGTEASGGSYARLQIDNTTLAFTTATVADPSSTENNEEWTFPEATASWGTITAVGVYDASTAGNLLMQAALDTSKAVDSGDTASFAAGSLVFTLD